MSNGIWCPVCDQGWIIRARVNANGSIVWVCQESEELWIGEGLPEGPPDCTLSIYLENLNLAPLWSQLTVLSS